MQKFRYNKKRIPLNLRRNFFSYAKIRENNHKYVLSFTLFGHHHYHNCILSFLFFFSYLEKCSKIRLKFISSIINFTKNSRKRQKELHIAKELALRLRIWNCNTMWKLRKFTVTLPQCGNYGIFLSPIFAKISWKHFFTNNLCCFHGIFFK